jgi:hypothetical protein
MTTLQRLRVLLVLAACALAACASSPSGGAKVGSGAAVLVTLRDYERGTQLELASESHTSRVEYYSQTRQGAARKIQTDPIMEALLEELERQGLKDHLRQGRAPAVGGGDVIRWGLELERGGTRAHWLIGPGSSADDWRAFQQCRDTFLQLYNITVSYQTVQNPDGKAFFEDEQRRTRDPGARP